MARFVTRNEEETYSLGYHLGAACHGGEVFLLCGDLGVGKTKLTQGLAAGLGVAATVNSPTFNIMKIYRSAGSVKNLCHIDAYRLNAASDLVSIGALEYIGAPDVVSVIEWAEIVSEIWTKGAKLVSLSDQGAGKRLITVSAWPAKLKRRPLTRSSRQPD